MLCMDERVSSLIDQPPRSLAVPAAASEPWSPTRYSAIPSSSTPSPILLLVSLGVTNGSRKDRIAEYFHLFDGPAADPLLFPASFRLSEVGVPQALPSLAADVL